MKALSPQNRYWLEDNRYRELKYFTLQYPSWKKEYLNYLGLCGLSKQPSDNTVVQTSNRGDPTAVYAILLDRLDTKMAMVEKAAKETDAILANYILRGVTEGLSYKQLSAQMDIPCSRDTYYRYCRKFYWNLDRIKD